MYNHAHVAADHLPRSVSPAHHPLFVPVSPNAHLLSSTVSLQVLSMRRDSREGEGILLYLMKGDTVPGLEHLRLSFHNLESMTEQQTNWNNSRTTKGVAGPDRQTVGRIFFSVK